MKITNSGPRPEELFTSKETSATYSLATDGVLLLGQSDSALADAEQKMRVTFTQHTFQAEDPGVQGLLREHNTSKTTVAILDPEGVRVTVGGYLEVVEEIGRTLRRFIVDNSRGSSSSTLLITLKSPVLHSSVHGQEEATGTRRHRNGLWR